MSHDAAYCKARVNRRVISQAVVIASGVAADARREVPGFDVGDSEDGAFWTSFLRSLKARGLTGTQLGHQELKGAIASAMLGAAWQRCRGAIHAQRPRGGPGGNVGMVAAAIQTVFPQPDAAHVTEGCWGTATRR